MPPFETAAKLRFHHMDRAGMVFHGAYATFFQDAFEDMMEAIGYVEKELEPELGVRVPVVRHVMEFPAAPRGDELELRVSVDRIGDASVAFELEARDRDGRQVARAEVVRVCIDEAGDATPIPGPLREGFERFTDDA